MVRFAYSVPELVDVTSLPRSIIRQELKARKLRVARFGPYTFVPIREIERWLDSHLTDDVEHPGGDNNG